MAINLAHSGTASNGAVAHRPWPVIVGGALARGRRAPGAFSPSEDYRSLDEVGTTVTFARNETIFNEGDGAKYAYKLVSGAVRLCKLLADGRRQITDFYLDGEMFGFLDLDSYDFSAEAITNVVLVRYARSHVRRFEEEDDTFRRELMSMLHQRLSRTHTLLVMLGRQTVKERIASFLIQMAERLDGEAEDGASIDLPMGRQDIADYLGLTIETVCRALSEFKRAGVISVPTTHQIVVNDIEALRAIIDGDN
ncbi:MAG: helix-turn-helix domain-containing protein [Parvibaculum sedimenti]|uniref:helix-turn-helix domain-containing protein n=1 Tax=Parvibaculum sedimenti TaxID=2608632 RepID=UPI003BB7D8E0